MSFVGLEPTTVELDREAQNFNFRVYNTNAGVRPTRSRCLSCLSKAFYSIADSPAPYKGESY